uniref:P-type domain-containing protein n=1 Tax=Macrostomum lignano TaxID=282301 RepID=A0A1I8G6W8_9PLAT
TATTDTTDATPVEASPPSSSRRLKLGLLLTAFFTLLIGLIVIAVLLAQLSTTPPPPPTPTPRPPNPPPSRRIDCLFDYRQLEGGASRANCEQRGCVFEEVADDSLGAPSCFYPDSSQRLGFDAVEVFDHRGGVGGLTAWLRPRGDGGGRYFGGNLPHLKLTATHLSDSTVRIQIVSANESRYEVPVPLDLPQTGSDRPRYEVSVTKEPFSFQVKRRSTGVIIFQLEPTAFIYADQLIQVATDLPSNKLLGIGETLKPKLLIQMDRFRTWALFSRDEPVFNEQRNHYGVHPFYMSIEPDNSAHGVLMWNSNAMEFVTTPGPKLVYRTTGGVFDQFLFLGPDPESVTAQYHQLVGRPSLPPYWSLGFHLSRYGYRSLAQINDTLARNRAIGLPIDVLHLDIDHLDQRRVFTVDPVNYAGLYDFLVDQRNRFGMRNIAILNPVVVINSSSYRPFELGRQMDAFVRWRSADEMPPGDFDFLNDTVLLGYVWPSGKVVFIDFFKNSAVEYWSQLLTEHHSTGVPFDGIWLDMNEPANFGTNEEKPWNWPEHARPYWSLKCNNRSLLEMPLYRPSAAYYWDSDDGKKVAQLSDKTICMYAMHSLGGGSQQRQLLHYNVHSLYGYAMESATRHALKLLAPSRRKPIVSRSNYPGSGAGSGTWLGDNDSSESHMRYATIGMLEFGLFGLPFVGADICGFFGTASAQLCTRWMQVGAFYPFSRNHNFQSSPDQDPAVYQQACPRCVQQMVRAVRQRYRLNPHFYTLFHRAHRHGGTVVRPLFFKSDSSEPLSHWLPPGVWFDITASESLTLANHASHAEGWGYRRVWKVDGTSRRVTTEVVAADPLPLVHLRGGYSLFTAAPTTSTRDQVESGRLQLLVAMSADETSQGELFWDDGESDYSDRLDGPNVPLFHVTVNCAKRRCIVSPTQDGIPSQPKLLESVTILAPVGNPDDPPPRELLINGRPVEFRYAWIDGDGRSRQGVVMATNLTAALRLNQRLEIEWRSDRRYGLSGRIDCAPEAWAGEGIGVDECSRRGCRLDDTHRDHLSGWVPRCYLDASTRPNSYRVHTSATRSAASSRSVRTVYGANRVDNMRHYAPGADRLEIGVHQLRSGALRIKITNPDVPRYEVPISLNLTEASDSSPLPLTASVRNDANGRLVVSVSRTVGSQVIWDTAPTGGLVYEDQFLQLAAALPTSVVYGLGEHTHPNLRHRFDYATWPMFSRDQPVGGMYGNFYGVHPLLIARDAEGGSFGIFFLNSNAQEVQFVPESAMVYRTIGGILDVYFLPGPTIGQVVSQYTELVGRPSLPPVWSLGYHLCRYGYNSLATMAATVQRNIDSGVPIDVQYADIDHFEGNRIFTYDRRNFDGLPRLVEQMRSQWSIRFVYLLDPTVVSNATRGTYPAYDTGLELDVFVKWPLGASPDRDIYGNDNLLGYAWPQGRVVFPDYFSTRAQDYWVAAIVNYTRDSGLTFDGLWLDMNEPANFGTNEERPWNWPEHARPYWSLKCNLSDKLETPPYKTKMWGPWISDKTICMNALHNDGKYRHYDVHSLYGKMQSIATDRAVKQITGKRGLVITRATFPGDGQFGGTWLGDNGKSWTHLRDSIIGMVEHGFFGIPFVSALHCSLVYSESKPGHPATHLFQVGADICGYFGDSVDRDLCLRWSQAGSWYPFSRSHNGLNGAPQDPAAFDPGTTAAIRESLVDRYRLLPYLYTQMRAAQTEGPPPVRALFQ